MITNALPDIPRSYTAICEWAACVVYIAVLFRRVPPRRSVVVSAIGLAALIAVNLAVMNLLPLPALDGGKIFFLVINAIGLALFKKQIPAKYENYIHFAGLVLLLALMAVITFSDVWKLIH